MIQQECCECLQLCDNHGIWGNDVQSHVTGVWPNSHSSQNGQNKIDSCKMLGKAMSYGCIGGGFAAYMKRHSCAHGPMEGISSVLVGAAGLHKAGRVW